MDIVIRKARKGKGKLRLAIMGPTGSGKTKTALMFATALVEGTGKRIAVIDTERESSELYADEFDFDIVPLNDTHSPKAYVAALKALHDTGEYGCVITDSLTHAWSGKEGALEQVDRAAKRNQGNSFVGWRDVTPMHNELVDALLRYDYHLIATLRVKMAYELVENERGKKVPQKLGLQPIQRDGMEYEFTVVCDMDVDHNLLVGKTRCSAVDGMVVKHPDESFARILREWIESGADEKAEAHKLADVRGESEPEAPKARRRQRASEEQEQQQEQQQEEKEKPVGALRKQIEAMLLKLGERKLNTAQLETVAKCATVMRNDSAPAKWLQQAVAAASGLIAATEPAREPGDDDDYDPALHNDNVKQEQLL